MWKKFILFVACFASLAAFAEPMKWADLVKEALEKNPELQASREALERARAVYRGGYSGFLPQLAANAGFTRSNSTTQNVGATTNGLLGGAGAAQDQFSYGLTASQNLFNGFSDYAKVNQGKANVASAEAAYDTASAKILFDLKSAYTQVLYAKKFIELTGEVASRRRDNFQLVELRYEGGRENKGSYLRIKAFYQQSLVDFEQSKRNYRNSLRQLAKALGRIDIEGLDALGDLEHGKPSTTPDFKAMVPGTPAHRQSEADFHSAEAGVTRSRAGFLPTLALNGAFSRTGPDFPLNTERWSVGVGLTVPIFPGGSNIFDYQAATADRARTEALVRNTDNQTVQKLQESFASYQYAVDSEGAQQEVLKAAELRSEISRSKYTTGLLSFEDWDLIENDLINQQKQMLATRRDSMLAEATWVQAQGKGFTP